jgi:curli production assembly/transport component CsgG
MKIKNLLVGYGLLFFLHSCGTYFNQPLGDQTARIGEDTRVSKDLKNLPEPNQPVVVGVYNFRDQTGQFKPTDLGSTFSTAVTQGATTILIKSLEDTKWFRATERENLNNLLNERQIIKSTREEYAQISGTPPERLRPLLFAGILLEGGIVSYDTNIVTGGLGARYFGIGSSTEYRQDRITIYLRAVSTSTGEILKSVYVSKTILSQALDASYFRFVSFQRLLEVETGFTRNEPVQLAVTEAVEKAVYALVIEGMADGLWVPKEGEEEKAKKLIDEYFEEKEEAADTKLYDRLQKDRRTKDVITVGGGASLLDGDIAGARPGYMVRMGYKRYFNSWLSAGLTANQFNLRTSGSFEEQATSVDLNAEFTILPYDRFTPFLYTGGGFNIMNERDIYDWKFQLGLGVEYMVSDTFGLHLFAEQNFVLNDEIDGIRSGRRDDFYYRFGLGINIYLGNNNKSYKTKSVSPVDGKTELNTQTTTGGNN